MKKWLGNIFSFKCVSRNKFHHFFRRRGRIFFVLMLLIGFSSDVWATGGTNSGTGADGRNIITYACPIYILTNTATASPVCSASTATIILT